MSRSDRFHLFSGRRARRSGGRLLNRRRRAAVESHLDFERLDPRRLLSATTPPNPDELIQVNLSAEQLAQTLVGEGVAVSQVRFTGSLRAAGSFNFVDPSVIGFSQGILLSSGQAIDVVGPNMSDATSTDFQNPGDADLDNLSGYGTFDAAILEFDFVPAANQVVFNYVFASDEYPEWVNTAFNDVFAFYVNGENHAVVREIAGDPNSPFVPVAVNNINDSNPIQTPPPTAVRPDLFRPNYYDPNGSSAFDFELDGITRVLTFQAPVVPGELNHMKLAIADASDGIYDSAVFIKAGSIISNESPVADLSVTPTRGQAPLTVTAFIEGEDPNGLPLTYSVDWGDGTTSQGPLDQPPEDEEKTAQVEHVYTSGGTYYVTLTVSNGSLSSTSVEDIDIAGGDDTIPPVAPGVGLLIDSGSSATDALTMSGELSLSEIEPEASVEYSVDGGDSWSELFEAIEGLNQLQVRQTDAAGNTSEATAFTFTLDTTAPTMNPQFSIDAQPFLQYTAGITVDPNASDSWGIDWESGGSVTTAHLGLNSVLCTAVDLAGNQASSDVPYRVGLAALNVTPSAGSTFASGGSGPKAMIPISFQLANAEGLISDTAAQGLKGLISVSFNGQTSQAVRYNSVTNKFNGFVKTAGLPAGQYVISVRVTVDGVDITTIDIPIQLA